MCGFAEDLGTQTSQPTALTDRETELESDSCIYPIVGTGVCPALERMSKENQVWEGVPLAAEGDHSTRDGSTCPTISGAPGCLASPTGTGFPYPWEYIKVVHFHLQDSFPQGSLSLWSVYPSFTAVFVILCVLVSHFDYFSLPDHKPHENEDCVCFDSLSDFPGGSDGKESAMQETRLQSQGWEDPLEKGMATHSSILGWRIPRTEESEGLQSMRSQRIVTTEWLTLNTLIKMLSPIKL